MRSAPRADSIPQKTGHVMKAALLTGIRSLEICDVPEPEPVNSDEVVLQVGAVGICGSDIHYYKMGRIGPQAVEFPMTLGHECAGTVVGAGDAVKGVRVGHRVAIDPLIACGRCDQCLAGRTHTCRNQKFMGCPGQASGALVERLAVPAACCFPLPDSMSMEQAAMVEPLSIGLYARRLAPLVPGATLGILGAGPIGCCVLFACGTAGECRTYVTDLLDHRLELARACGADWTANPNSIDIAGAISKLEPSGLDIVFECAGQQEALNLALELLKPGGTLLVVGIPELDRVSFDIHLLRRKEVTIKNVRRQNNCIAPAIDLMSSGAVNVDRLITHRFPLGQAETALDLLENYRDGVMKTIVQVSAE
jgi:L-iditol 2-dehydrogenase